MAYYSKYKGAELEERLDKVEEIPQLIAQMITGKNFVTKEDLLCVLKDYAPADYRTIPIDNNTIYWENGVLKAATSEGGQCQWELREHNGIQYLYSRLPVVTQYDVTMYADVNHLDLPSIYDGLPIDGDTIYWEETENGRILKSKYEGSSGVDASEVLSIVSSAGYATQNWVNNQNFISSSFLYTELDKYVKIKDYQEIEGVKNFLNGLQIAGLPITKLNGYEDVIYIDANVVVRGGVTMYYQDGEVDLPSIIDEIGIAGYDGKKLGLVSFSSSQFSIDINGNVTIKGGSTGLDTAQLKEYLDSNKYTTETWVKAQGYASASSLSSLQTKVNNFLEGSDTDTIINKWKELEVFLSGLSESDNLATILSTKWTTDNSLINKWNTAYGWGNHASVGYALKSYVDDTFVTIKGNEDVTGVHDFVNGLKIGNIKLSKSQEGVVYLEGNLVVKGGVTMYALDEITVDSIIDSLPIASTSQYGIAKFNPSNFVINEDGFVTIIGGSGGLDTEELAEYLATNKYATQGWVEGKGYITSSALNGYATQSWVTNQKYITGITSAMVVAALGYTPFNNASFTKANIKSTLGISDWALASSKPSYTTKEVSEDTNLYFTNQRAIDALASTLKSYATDTELSSGLATKADKTINISAGTGLTGGGTLAANRTLSLATSGVSAGTYKSVTVDTYGRVTAGSNPTTLAGYGITDAYTKQQLDNTFALYIPIAGYTDVTGEKNFTGGLRVNNSPSIYYDATNKYWKLEGDLLVTGGVTMYGTDEGDLPSILDSLPIASTSSAGIASFDSTYFSVNTSGKVILTSALSDLFDVESSVSGTTSSDVVLFKSANSSTWTTKPLSEIGGGSSGGGSVSGDYLPLSGGTLTGNLVFGANSAGISFTKNGSAYGALRLSDDNEPSWMYSKTWAWETIIHTGNYSSYALPLSGGTINGAGDYLYVPLFVNALNNQISGITFKTNGTERGHVGFHYEFGMRLHTASKAGIAVSNSDVPIFYTEDGAVKNTILHSGNYSSYALPLTGGSLSGMLTVASELTGITINNTKTGRTPHITFQTKGSEVGALGISTANVPQMYNAVTGTWHTILTDDNYSSYALPLSGGTCNWININYTNTLDAESSVFIIKRKDRGRFIEFQGDVGFFKCVYNFTHTSTNVDIHVFNKGTSYISKLQTASVCPNLDISGGSVTIGGWEGSKFYFDTENIRLGIGTPKPNRELHVVGNIYASKTVEATDIWTQVYHAGGVISYSANTTGYFRFGTFDETDGGMKMQFGGTGTTGTLQVIDQAWKKSLFKLDKSGNVVVAGGISMYSDQRKKTILNHVELSLKQIADAPLIEHYYNSDQNKTTHVGSIAQYWAGLNDWFCKLDNEGFYTMEIQNCALASAISIARHLEKYESKTDKKIRQLKKRISQLEDELELLKKGV